ncbi:MAG: Ni/Fe-hydrogenase, b-type cytochrome subunit [Nitrospirae bacterium]|nr:Ni/Fe-hydrogenase, b-type cytochrome subunit [Nitrospirota bacterium]
MSANTMNEKIGSQRRVYVWEFPVRLTHWVNVAAITALSVTGFMIGGPHVHSVHTEDFAMGMLRFIHLLAGYVFVASLLVRLYWAFAGNDFASWRHLFPFGRPKACSVSENLKYYLFMGGQPPFAVGHTALGGVFYCVICVVYIVMFTTGFALHQQSIYPAFAKFMGGWMWCSLPLQTVKLVHHVSMYAIIGAVVMHIYIAMYLDRAEKNSLIGSIFDGYKILTGRERC